MPRKPSETTAALQQRAAKAEVEAASLRVQVEALNVHVQLLQRELGVAEASPSAPSRIKTARRRTNKQSTVDGVRASSATPISRSPELLRVANGTPQDGSSGSGGPSPEPQLHKPTATRQEKPPLERPPSRAVDSAHADDSPALLRVNSAAFMRVNSNHSLASSDNSEGPAAEPPAKPGAAAGKAVAKLATGSLRSFECPPVREAAAASSSCPGCLRKTPPTPARAQRAVRPPGGSHGSARSYRPALERSRSGPEACGGLCSSPPTLHLPPPPPPPPPAGDVDFDAAVVAGPQPEHAWTSCPGRAFNVRAGPNYSRTGLKLPSLDALYDVAQPVERAPPPARAAPSDPRPMCPHGVAPRAAGCSCTRRSAAFAAGRLAAAASAGGGEEASRRCVLPPRSLRPTRFCVPRRSCRTSRASWSCPRSSDSRSTAAGWNRPSTRPQPRAPSAPLDHLKAQAAPTPPGAPPEPPEPGSEACRGLRTP